MGTVNSDSDELSGSSALPHSSTFSPAARTNEHKSVDVLRRRILIVDDNIDAADTLSMMLNFQGHETATAYNSTQALALVDSFHPEVVLLDIGLPGMDGYEVARRIRAMPSAKPIQVIALTGYGQAEDLARALRDGFDAHLIKPINPEELQKLLAARSA